MKKNFTLMLHYGRVGSTVLSDLVGQATGVKSFGEVFNFNVGLDWMVESSDYTKIQNINRNDLALLSIDDAFFLLNVIVNSSNNIGFNNYMLEIKQWDFDRRVFSFTLSEFMEKFEDIYNASYIHLYRMNLYERYVSDKIASITSLYHLKKDFTEMQNITLKEVNFDIDELIDSIRSVAAKIFCNKLLFLNKKAIEIVYELHISENPIQGAQMVLDFIGVDGNLDFKIEYHKTSASYSNLTILNLDEIKTAMNNASLSCMIKN